LEIKVKKLHPDAVLPKCANETDAGYDLVAIDEGEIVSEGLDIMYIQYRTGIAIAPPEGYHTEIFPRSSISKKQLFLANSVGLVDCVPRDTLISTPNGNIVVQDLFEKNDKSLICSFNETDFLIEEDTVSDMWIVDNIELYQIQTDEGDILEIPANKLVYTDNGWKKACELKENDNILKF